MIIIIYVRLHFPCYFVAHQVVVLYAFCFWHTRNRIVYTTYYTFLGIHEHVTCCCALCIRIVYVLYVLYTRFCTYCIHVFVRFVYTFLHVLDTRFGGYTNRSRARCAMFVAAPIHSYIYILDVHIYEYICTYTYMNILCV